MSMRVQRLALKAKLFRGLGDSTRLTILELLRGGEKAASQIVKETGQSQSNVSNHLACLLECGLVKNRREGKNIFYSISGRKVSRILEQSDNILSDIADEIYSCIHYNEKQYGRRL